MADEMSLRDTVIEKANSFQGTGNTPESIKAMLDGVQEMTGIVMCSYKRGVLEVQTTELKMMQPIHINLRDASE